MSPSLASSDHLAFGDESMFLYNIIIALDKRETGESDLDLSADKWQIKIISNKHCRETYICNFTSLADLCIVHWLHVDKYYWKVGHLIEWHIPPEPAVAWSFDKDGRFTFLIGKAMVMKSNWPECFWGLSKVMH